MSVFYKFVYFEVYIWRFLSTNTIFRFDCILQVYLSNLSFSSILLIFQKLVFNTIIFWIFWSFFTISFRFLSIFYKFVYFEVFFWRFWTTNAIFWFHSILQLDFLHISFLSIFYLSLLIFQKQYILCILNFFVHLRKMFVSFIQFHSILFMIWRFYLTILTNSFNFAIFSIN